MNISLLSIIGLQVTHKFMLQRCVPSPWFLSHEPILKTLPVCEDKNRGFQSMTFLFLCVGEIGSLGFNGTSPVRLLIVKDEKVGWLLVGLNIDQSVNSKNTTKRV